MRVRANGIYRFNKNYFLDYNAELTNHTPLNVGDLVKVINLPGCPRANTMGQCYVQLVGDRSGAFAMVSTSSLEKQ